MPVQSDLDPRIFFGDGTETVSYYQVGADDTALYLFGQARNNKCATANYKTAKDHKERAYVKINNGGIDLDRLSKEGIDTDGLSDPFYDLDGQRTTQCDGLDSCQEDAFINPFGTKETRKQGKKPLYDRAIEATGFAFDASDVTRLPRRYGDERIKLVDPPVQYGFYNVQIPILYDEGNFNPALMDKIRDNEGKGRYPTYLVYRAIRMRELFQEDFSKGSSAVKVVLPEDMTRKQERQPYDWFLLGSPLRRGLYILTGDETYDPEYKATDADPAMKRYNYRQALGDIVHEHFKFIAEKAGHSEFSSPGQLAFYGFAVGSAKGGILSQFGESLVTLFNQTLGDLNQDLGGYAPTWSGRKKCGHVYDTFRTLMAARDAAENPTRQPEKLRNDKNVKGNVPESEAKEHMLRGWAGLVLSVDVDRSKLVKNRMVLQKVTCEIPARTLALYGAEDARPDSTFYRATTGRNNQPAAIGQCTDDSGAPVTEKERKDDKPADSQKGKAWALFYWIRRGDEQNSS